MALSGVKAVLVVNRVPSVLSCRFYWTYRVAGGLNPFVLREPSTKVFGNGDDPEWRSDAAGPAHTLAMAKSLAEPSLTKLIKPVLPSQPFSLTDFLFSSNTPTKFLWLVVSVNDLAGVDLIVNIDKAQIRACEWFAFNLTAVAEIARAQQLFAKNPDPTVLPVYVSTPQQCADLAFLTAGHSQPPHLPRRNPPAPRKSSTAGRPNGGRSWHGGFGGRLGGFGGGVGRAGGVESAIVLGNETAYPVVAKWYRTNPVTKSYEPGGDQSYAFRPGCRVRYDRMPEKRLSLLSRRDLLVSRAFPNGNYCTFPAANSLSDKDLDTFVRNNRQNFALLRGYGSRASASVSNNDFAPRDISQPPSCPREAPLSGSPPVPTDQCVRP